MSEPKTAENPPAGISVVIPCYNDEDTIARCVESVRRQTLPATDVVVVDDCSTDGSLRIADSLGVTVVRSERNGGPSVARNLGAAHAQGTYLFFLDSDVALEPDGLAAAVDHLANVAGTGAICGVLDPESLTDAYPLQRYRAIQLHSWPSKDESDLAGLHSAIFAIRADVFTRIGGFDERLRATEEQELGHRLRLAGYDIRVTRTIRGRHNHDSSLRVLLPKVFGRARVAGPIRRWRERGVPGGSSARALAGALELVALAVTPFTMLIGFWALGVAAVLVATAVLLDHRRHRYAFLRYGFGFGLYFAGVHLLINLAATIGTGIGMLEGFLPGHQPGRHQLHRQWSAAPTCQTHPTPPRR